jgi:hypothetical protein
MTTRYTVTQLNAEADALLPDNTTQQISPADVRNVLKHMLSTLRLSVTTMRRDTNLVLPLSPTLQTIKPWSVNPYSDPPESVANLTTGQITKQVTSLGNAKAMDRITFYIGVAGTAGVELTFILYRNGAATDIIGRVSTDGAGNVRNAALSGVLEHTDDSVYEVKVSSTNTANYTFTNGTFRVEDVSIPT